RQQQLLRVDPHAQRLVGDVTSVHEGGDLLREAEAELSFVQADELLQRRLDAATDERGTLRRRELARGGVHGGAVPGEARDHQAALEDDGALPGRRAYGQPARPLAEGDNLEDVEEREVLEVA